MADLVFSELPRIGPLLARSVTGMIGGRRGGAIPQRAAIVASHRMDVGRLARYDRLCGFSVRDFVPPTWLHVLTFPLQAALMAQPDFPYALPGLVHATNTMTQHRPVAVTEEIALIVRAGAARAHTRGVLFDLVGEVRDRSGAVVWSGTSTYLARGAAAPRDPSPNAEPGAMPDVGDAERVVAGTPSQQWHLPADLGRRYARVSGDVNPIHLSVLAARAAGFRRPLIHGMWTHARALAALMPRLPASYRVSVRFTRPILLPARVGFVTDGGGFAVVDQKGKPSMLGAVDGATVGESRLVVA